jgi:hypothetical protein
MKKTGPCLIIALLIVATSGYSQVTNKDEMVKKVFAVFKNKDENGFVKLFPDAATMKAFIKKSMPVDTSEGRDNGLNSYMDEMTDSSWEKDLRKDFKKYFKKGEVKGINWNQATFASYKSDSSIIAEDDLKTPHLTGKIYFNIGSKEYFMEFKDVIWFENQGWYGVEIVQVNQKSKENQIGDDVDDSNVKPAKPVQKQSIKPKPAAGKVQTPVRKSN